MGHGPLLVVVDMQRVFGEPSSPWATPAFGSIVEPIDRLVLASHDRVVFTRFIVPEEPKGSWANYYGLWEFARQPGSKPMFDLVEPWASSGVRTIEAATFSKFGPEMAALAGPSREIVVCGVTTDCCVIATVIDALDAGMHVRVVADACAGVDDDAHEQALAIMAGFRGQVELTTVEEELAARELA